jgi:hypothetical protein
MAKPDETITIEDAELVWPNFKGKEGRFNRDGQKTFCIFLPEAEVDGLKANLWNVKYTNPREDDEDHVIRPYLPVEARFDPKPPKIVMITNEGKTRTFLDEDSVEVLDYADIKTVDVVLNPYDWTMPNGDTGRKAYLKTMFVTINEDALERKYAKLMEEKKDD